MVLAILDTGCYLHQDFIDDFDIAKSIFWDNAGETDCSDGIDNDGNGYIDDCFGWVRKLFSWPPRLVPRKACFKQSIEVQHHHANVRAR